MVQENMMMGSMEKKQRNSDGEQGESVNLLGNFFCARWRKSFFDKKIVQVRFVLHLSMVIFFFFFLPLTYV